MLTSKTLEINRKNGVEYITFPRFSACEFVRHAFSTRIGGVSTGPCASMNLSFSKDSSRENVIENYRRICDVSGIDVNNLVLSRQEHTVNIKNVTRADCGTGIFRPPFKAVDGLITDEPGIGLVTQYADCTPLLFCDVKKRVIATSHSGWRGTVNEMGRVTVEKMVKDYGCERENIIAAIGPCILDCCYEVDDPVFNEFGKITYLNPETIFKKKENGRYMLNLAEANRQIVLKSGISAENIDITDICTCCNSDVLHSHRATGGKRGNLAALIQMV